MNNRAHLENALRECIGTSFLADGQATTLNRDTDLLGVLDSLQLLRLVVQLEATYSVKVEDGELTPENLGTVERMAAFIAGKQEKTAASIGEPRGAS